MEKAIKQRLLGGLVLIAGAVLLLPLFLDGAGAPLTVPPMPVPPQVPGVEAIAPKLDQKVTTAEQSVSAAHVGQTFAPTTPGNTAASGDKGSEEVVPDAAAATAPVAESKPPAAGQAAQAKAASEKAAKEKPPEQQKTAQLKAPQTVQTKSSSAAQSEVVALPAAWIVQVASLSSHDKAEALVQKLRKKNYHAVSHQQGSVWKVVVGPELSREVADSQKARLAADPELKLNGWVQAYRP